MQTLCRGSKSLKFLVTENADTARYMLPGLFSATALTKKRVFSFLRFTFHACFVFIWGSIKKEWWQEIREKEINLKSESASSGEFCKGEQPGEVRTERMGSSLAPNSNCAGTKAREEVAGTSTQVEQGQKTQASWAGTPPGILTHLHPSDCQSGLCKAVLLQPF